MTIARVALVLVLATIAALASSFIERFGPDQAIFCALGQSIEGYDIYCPKPVLNGGWPAPYLVDNPSISRPNQLAFVEDYFRLWPFVSNIAFYAWVIVCAGTVLRRARSRGKGERA